jgi:tripartite-type tricarboxylate transporter receptor subunit TctC
MKRSLALALCALVSALTFAEADDYPARPVTMVMPFAAGGPGDIIARLLTPVMGASLGQAVTVENVVGAGGTIGTNRVAKAQADGYTLLLMHVGQATSATLFRKLPYDPVGDFEPIGLVTDAPMILVAPNDFPAKTFTEAMAHMKAKPDSVLLGNAGVGSASHLCGLLLMDRLGTKLTTVQYRGGGPALIDVMAGRLSLWCDPANGPIPYVAEGKMKAFAITTGKRLKQLSDVPTAQEAGLADFQVSTWYGLYAPKGTPAPVLEKIGNALRAALRDPTVKERFEALSLEPMPDEKATPEALRAHLSAEIAKWSPIIKKAGVFAD